MWALVKPGVRAELARKVTATRHLDLDHLGPEHGQLTGLPPEKWSSLRYGFEPSGGRENGEEATYGGGDRRQAAAG